MSQITTAILAGFAANHRIHGEQATIRIGDEALTHLDVIPGKSEAETLDPTTLLATNMDLQDLHIGSADRVSPGTRQRLTPERGWIVELIRNAQVRRFTPNHTPPVDINERANGCE